MGSQEIEAPHHSEKQKRRRGRRRQTTDRRDEWREERERGERWEGVINEEGRRREKKKTFCLCVYYGKRERNFAFDSNINLSPPSLPFFHEVKGQESDDKNHCPAETCHTCV